MHHDKLFGEHKEIEDSMQNLQKAIENAIILVLDHTKRSADQICFEIKIWKKCGWALHLEWMQSVCLRNSTQSETCAVKTKPKRNLHKFPNFPERNTKVVIPRTACRHVFFNPRSQ